MYYCIESIQPHNLISLKRFKKEFKEFYIYEMKRDEKEIAMLMKILEKDFENPYKSKYIEHYYRGRRVINNVEYEIYYCRVLYAPKKNIRASEDLTFEFFLLYDLRDIVDGTVKEYLKAEKMYVI